MNTVT